jgi:preprotein translocase subunit YajC
MLNDLILIIGVCLIMGLGMYISDWRRKKQEERQARLNSIRFPK